jgi:Fur family ferric uptake transcriptional regulator
MNIKDEEKKRLRIYLEKSDLKLTPARKIVLEEVLRYHGHFTGEELCRTIKSKNEKASRASVYRAIKELLEAGIIRETAFGEKHKHYEHIYDEKHHHHARCIRCHRVVEFPCDDYGKKYEPFLKKSGFEVLGHELHFYGICKKCKGR